MKTYTALVTFLAVLAAAPTVFAAPSPDDAAAATPGCARRGGPCDGHPERKCACGEEAILACLNGNWALSNVCGPHQHCEKVAGSPHCQ